MAGVARIVIGVFLLLLALLFFVTLIGFFLGIIFLIIAVVFIASGVSARDDTERMRYQQQQTNVLLQQQLQWNAMQSGRQPSYPPPQYGAPAPQFVPPAPVSTGDKFCSSCGQGNARVAAFCQKCGKPLPPPG